MAVTARTSRLITGASLLLLALGCLLRLSFLGADPYYYRWVGFINDEGRWVEHARRAALGGAWTESASHNEHLLLSPVFSAVSYVAFTLGGVSATAARVFPALSGCLLLILLFVFLRKRVPPEGLFLGLATVALQGDFVILSRLAIPEMPMALGALGVFCVLHGLERPRPVLAGALCGLTLAIKATAFPLVPLFAFLAFAYRSGPLSLRDRERWRHAGGFAAGLGAVGLLGLIALLVAAPGPAPGLATDLGHIAGFLRPATLQTLATIPLYSSLSPVLNVTALGVWTLLLCEATPRRAPVATETATIRRLRRAAWAWLAIYPAQMLCMEYLPPRYQVHLLVPASILFAASFPRLASFSPGAVADALERLSGARRVLARALYVFPSFVWCIPVFASLAFLLDLPLHRVRFRAPFLAVAIVSALWLARSSLPLSASRAKWLFAFPWVCSSIWFALFLVLPGRVPFWPDALPGALGGVGIVALGAGAARACLETAGRRMATRVPLAIAGGLSFFWALHLAPGWATPSYELRDISRALGEELRDADLILTTTEGLFLNNTLRHHDPLDDPVDDSAPAAYHVVAGELPEPEEMERRYRFSERYELVRRFPLHPPAPFLRTCRRTYGCGPDFSVRVSRRRDPAAMPAIRRGENERDILLPSIN